MLMKEHPRLWRQYQHMKKRCEALLPLVIDCDFDVDVVYQGDTLLTENACIVQNLTSLQGCVLSDNVDPDTSQEILAMYDEVSAVLRPAKVSIVVMDSQTTRDIVDKSIVAIKRIFYFQLGVDEWIQVFRG